MVAGCDLWDRAYTHASIMDFRIEGGEEIDRWGEGFEDEKKKQNLFHRFEYAYRGQLRTC